MAIIDGSAFSTRLSNPSPHQLQLFSLISELCAPRGSLPRDAYCRLIVDSRLPWADAPIDARRSWLYLTQPAQVWRMADCLVLTGD